MTKDITGAFDMDLKDFRKTSYFFLLIETEKERERERERKSWHLS